MTKASRINPLSLSALAVLTLAAHAHGQNDDEAFQRSVEERLTRLEAQRPPSTTLTDRLTFSGLVEVEGSVGEVDDESYSDLVVATVELGFSARINDRVSTAVVLLYEEDETDLDVDVATITIDKLVGPLTLDVGKMYVPFGRFETALVNDTLVLEAGETNKTAALFGLTEGLFSAGAYVFNGDADREDHAENYGVTFTIGNDDYSVGVDYLSALTEADSWLEQTWAEHPAAYVVSARAGLGEVTLLAEYLAATDDLVAEGETTGFQPTVFHLEASIGLNWNGRAFTAAVAWQQTDDAAGYLPEERLSLGVSTAIYENLSLGVEYWHDEDYSIQDNGSGGDSDNLVLQLAVTF